MLDEHIPLQTDSRDATEALPQSGPAPRLWLMIPSLLATALLALAISWHEHESGNQNASRDFLERIVSQQVTVEIVQIDDNGQPIGSKNSDQPADIDAIGSKNSSEKPAVMDALGSKNSSERPTGSGSIGSNSSSQKPTDTAGIGNNNSSDRPTDIDNIGSISSSDKPTDIDAVGILNSSDRDTDTGAIGIQSSSEKPTDTGSTLGSNGTSAAESMADGKLQRQGTNDSVASEIAELGVEDEVLTAIREDTKDEIEELKSQVLSAADKERYEAVVKLTNRISSLEETLKRTEELHSLFLDAERYLSLRVYGKANSLISRIVFKKCEAANQEEKAKLEEELKLYAYNEQFDNATQILTKIMAAVDSCDFVAG